MLNHGLAQGQANARSARWLFWPHAQIVGCGGRRLNCSHCVPYQLARGRVRGFGCRRCRRVAAVVAAVVAPVHVREILPRRKVMCHASLPKRIGSSLREPSWMLRCLFANTKHDGSFIQWNSLIRPKFTVSCLANILSKQCTSQHLNSVDKQCPRCGYKLLSHIVTQDY